MNKIWSQLWHLLIQQTSRSCAKQMLSLFMNIRKGNRQTKEENNWSFILFNLLFHVEYWLLFRLLRLNWEHNWSTVSTYSFTITYFTTFKHGLHAHTHTPHYGEALEPFNYIRVCPLSSTSKLSSWSMSENFALVLTFIALGPLGKIKSIFWWQYTLL